MQTTDRAESVRGARDAFRYLLTWLAGNHPEITSLTGLTRDHIEAYLTHLHDRINPRNGRPLAARTRYGYISPLLIFFREASQWGWDDVPSRPLLGRSDLPKLPARLPRFIPRDELDRLMKAIEGLENPYQRTALLLVRWSCARKGEIRRLTIDCLDAYPDGYPRLRIPVGKTYTERMIPLHPQAAEALRELIELAKAAAPAARFDTWAQHPVRWVFMHRGQPMGKLYLFDEPLEIACHAAGLLDARGRPAVSAHRFRHTVGTQLAEGGAQIQTIMAILGHRSASMSATYSHISDPVLREQYEKVIAAGGRVVGPAAEALLASQFDQGTLDWLKTNYFKTELELGHSLRLDRLIRARAIHSMTGQVYRCVGLQGPRIAAVSADPHGLDDLAGQRTVTVDAGGLTLLPAFSDSHEHLMEASRNTLLVPVDKARSIAEFTAQVGAAARDAAPGEWVVTSMGWHESNLAENRLPTGAELDAAAPDHPVLARRGRRLAIASTAALTAAGIGPGTPDPAGGKIGRLPDGRPDGLLEGGAVYQVAAFAPATGRAHLAEALRRGSAAYAALGVGTIREAMINLDELLAYQDAAERGLLSVRVRPLIRVGNELSESEALALIRGLGARSGFGDDWLRLWGLKFVMDGGVEGGATDQPYADDPANTGHLNWDPAVMTRVCAEAVHRGWRIGTHAAGDRAVRTVLDVYEAVAAQVGDLPPWTLVIEHALLSDAAMRARAVRGGFGVTVQHPLLWNMGSEMLAAWGHERTSRVSPLDEWLALGASLAAGTDIARPFNPMTAVWGMVARGTKSAGVQGPGHAIDVATALELYTMGSARLNHEANRLGSITPGKLADLAAYPADPFTADTDVLAALGPVFTIVGGRPVHDPHGLLGKVEGEP